MTTNRSSLASLLLVGALSGCGVSAASKPPVTHPKPAPRPTSTPAANPAYETVQGQLLAVSSVLGDVDSSLTSALNALNEQLPDSARANLNDADAGLAGVAHVLAGTSPPAAYARAVGLLHTSEAHYRLAVAEGLNHAAAAQADETAGHAALARAVTELAKHPEATQSGTLQAQALALAAAHRAGSVAIAARQPVHRPTAQPLAKRLPTRRHPAATFAVAITTPLPVRTATLVRTATPAPTSTPRPAATSTPKPVARVVVKPIHRTSQQHPITHSTPNYASFLRALAGGSHTTAAAAATLQQGANYLQSTSGPLDPRSTADAISYLDLANGEVRTALRAVTTPARGTSRVPANSSLGHALTAYHQAQQHLQTATAAVQAGQPGAAAIEMALAGNYLHLAQRYLARAQKALRATR